MLTIPNFQYSALKSSVVSIGTEGPLLNTSHDAILQDESSRLAASQPFSEKLI